MLIDDRLQAAAFYIARKPLAGRAPATLCGTAFMVGMNMGDESARLGTMDYAVTAAHIIENTPKKEEIVMYVNNHSGSQTCIPLPKKSWEPHPDTDIAVCPIDWSGQETAQLDVLSFPFDRLMTPEAVSRQIVGAGDEVTMVGLFPKFPGKQRVQPVARFGHISLMPHEPICLKIHGEDRYVDAYLIEALTWQGMSGCPVIIYPTRAWGDRGTASFLPYYVLGLVHGLCDLDTELKFPHETKHLRINLGMSVVIPSAKIIETLMSETLKNQRETLVKGWLEQHRGGT